MIGKTLKILSTLGLLSGGTIVPISPGAASGAGAKIRSGAISQTRNVQKKSPPPTLRSQVLWIRQKYAAGTMPRRAAWDRINDLTNPSGNTNITAGDRHLLLLTQSNLLADAGYPISSALYAAKALTQSQNVLAKDMEPFWQTLHRVAEKSPIQTLLENVASDVSQGSLKGQKVPAFGSNWNYFWGNAAAQREGPGRAIQFYEDVKYGDRYYFAAKYQEALILIDHNKMREAEGLLKKILVPAATEVGPEVEEMRRKVSDFARIALARLYYEEKRFVESIRMYRSVDRKSRNFYDALFEQSWAFFMAGYPMHALGALHGAESPFYAEVFNPEATLLRSLIHYWLCRYDDSRNALAEFLEKYSKDVESLKDYLDRRHIEPENAYQLFENLISGVSSDSIGLPKPILKTVAERDSLLFARNQYAALVEEKKRLEARGMFGSKKGLAKPLSSLDQWISAVRTDLGRRYLAELQDVKKDFERLYEQAEFLYLELLMSEKDQLLGKALHASTKITRVSSQLKVSGWAEKTQAWKDSRNGEYWWDEIGFYISPVESMCQVSTLP